MSTACNFCGANDARPVHRLRDWRLALPGEFVLVECRVCGLMYLDPQPEWSELVRHYPNDYEPYAAEAGLAGYRQGSKHYGLRRRCRAIAAFHPAGRLLDVGCASGSFLDEVRRQGSWEPFGVEPVAAPAAFARERLGLNVFTGTLEAARFPSNGFDVITFWDVLEHVEDPNGSLQEAVRILKPGGYLVVQVPNPQSWQAHRFGRYWAGFDAPRHLYAFPETTLRRVLAALGFDQIVTRSLEGGNSIFWRSLCGGAHRAKPSQFLSTPSERPAAPPSGGAAVCRPSVARPRTVAGLFCQKDTS